LEWLTEVDIRDLCDWNVYWRKRVVIYVIECLKEEESRNLWAWGVLRIHFTATQNIAEIYVVY